MAFEGLKKMLNPDDQDYDDYEEVVETSKHGNKENYKNFWI